MSGETFFTLGFGDFTPTTTLGRFLAVVEAGLGFGFLGTVVGYLPTMYSAFAQREIEISMMDARAGSPPTAVEFLRRTNPSGDCQLCDSMLSALPTRMIGCRRSWMASPDSSSEFGAGLRNTGPAILARLRSGDSLGRGGRNHADSRERRVEQPVLHDGVGECVGHQFLSLG